MGLKPPPTSTSPTPNLRLSALFGSLLLCVASSACTYDANIAPVDTVEVRFPSSDKLDILFVIDDSGSMAAKQKAMSQNLAGLIEELETLPKGGIDIRIGVTSTTMGVGTNSIGGCHDRPGYLSQQPGCELMEGDFLTVHLEGRESDANVISLEQAFECIASIGDGGCGYEQPLLAMEKAIGAPDFLRDDAKLGIVILTDEDDCSSHDPDTFFSFDDPQFSPGSFRCTEFGVTCDGVSISRDPGEYRACIPIEDSPYLTNVGEFVRSLVNVKGETESVMIGVIAGGAEGLTVVSDHNLDPEAGPACSGSNGNAYPAHRLTSFAKHFNHSAVTSICDEDMSATMGDIGRMFFLGMVEHTHFVDVNAPDATGCRVGNSDRGDIPGSMLVIFGMLALMRRRRST